MSNRIGESIRKARNEKGWTQAQLADAIRVKRSVISKYENGLIEPSISKLSEIDAALGTEFVARESSWVKSIICPVGAEAIPLSDKALSVLNDVSSSATPEGKQIIDSLIQMLDDSAKADQKRQKAAEEAVGGDYQVYLMNFLIQNADILALLQHVGYKIEVTGRASACIQSGPVKYMMTTSDLVERISKLNKTMEGLVSSFPEMRKEADDDAPQAKP